MNTPRWLAALRPVDLMSAAAALNPDAVVRPLPTHYGAVAAVVVGSPVGPQVLR